MSRRYFTPICCRTGAVHQQPQAEQLHSGAYAFTADFSEAFDVRGAIDAPDAIPCGSVRALDFDRLRIGCAHTYRDGWRS